MEHKQVADIFFPFFSASFFPVQISLLKDLTESGSVFSRDVLDDCSCRLTL